jgi:hypothetical protein
MIRDMSKNALQEALAAAHKAISTVEKLVAAQQRDAEYGRKMREAAAAADTGRKGTTKVAAAGKKTKLKIKRRVGRPPKSSNVTDEQIVEAIRSAGREGAPSSVVTATTGLAGERLRLRLVKLRQSKKVVAKGQRNQMRYFAS